MKTYQVKVKIIGEATIEVEADDENDAVSKAKDAITSDNFDYWEASNILVIVELEV